jgi:peptide/nickel transport system substrate-binding protein
MRASSSTTAPDFNAEDVKFSLDRARADDSTNAQKALCSPTSKGRGGRSRHVKVTLSKPNGSFLFNMAWGDAVIVAPESAADNGKSGRHRPVQIRPNGSRATGSIGRNDGYWGEPGQARQGDLQVHLRPDRGLRRDDGRRR